jgi:CheY-like chemotaxis protein
VVDDVVANRAIAADLLIQLGFEVIEATDGRQALATAQTRRPDCILMDIVMPEMDGLEVTRRLRRLPDFKDVPIIAMSARLSGSDKQKSRVAGVNAFLPKPIDLEQLLTHIAAILNLEWTYETQATTSAQEEQTVGPLVAPPPQQLERLHQLARIGNMREIVQWAERVAELDERYHPFAYQLCLLAKGYQSKAILTLVERYLEKDGVHNTAR